MRLICVFVCARARARACACVCACVHARACIFVVITHTYVPAALLFGQVLLGEVRHRSRSFTEGNSSRAPQPPSDTHPPPLHRGWTSSPTTPRDSQRDDSADVRAPPRHPRQRDVTESSDGGARDAPPSASCTVRHPRQRCVSDDDTVRDGTPDDVRNSDVASSHRRDADVEVNRCDVQGGRTTAYSARADDANGDSEATRDDDGDRLPGRRKGEQQQVHVALAHTRTYSAAWDEYDSGGEEPDSPNHNSSVDDKPNRVRSKCSGRESADGDETWMTTASNIPAQAESASERGKGARAHTIPRDKPSTLPPSYNHAADLNSRQPVESVANPRDDEPLAKHSYSETLGRKPRGPILRYFQRTREAESELASSVSRRATSLERPREQKPDFPSSPRKSSAEPQRSRRSDSAGPAQEQSRSTTALPERPSNLPTALPINRRSSPGGPQSPRNSSSPSSSGVLPSPRSSSQGPPPNPRKSSSGIPVSSKGSSSGPPQSPRRSSASHPASPRSSSVGPPQSPRSPSEKKPPERSRIPRGSGGKGEGGRREEEEGKRDRGRGGRARPMAVMELAAGDLQAPSMHGYLHRKTFNDQWVR